MDGIQAHGLLLTSSIMERDPNVAYSLKDCVCQVIYIIGKKSSIFVISNLVIMH